MPNKRIYLCLAHMSEAGLYVTDKDVKYIVDNIKSVIVG